MLGSNILGSNMEETQTQDYVWYDVKFKEPKDQYSLRKYQTKPVKALKFINALLKHNEIMFWYDNNGKEEMCVATLKNITDEQLLDMSLEVVTFGIYTYVQCYTIRAVTVPSNDPINIPIRKLKKFMLKNDNVLEISRSLTSFEVIN